jgi:lactate dehydrogenase-like 2-hydroxyacid dehydrogenase
VGTKPYEDFDAEFLSALVPNCKIIVSASAGYDEFAVDWMTANGIWFCNTRNAVAECTADMTMFLILAVLKDTTRAEKSVRTGKWRLDHVPTVSPSGLTLGIVGMGAIGQVCCLITNSVGLEMVQS